MPQCEETDIGMTWDSQEGRVGISRLLFLCGEDGFSFLHVMKSQIRTSSLKTLKRYGWEEVFNHVCSSYLRPTDAQVHYKSSLGIAKISHFGNRDWPGKLSVSA